MKPHKKAVVLMSMLAVAVLLTGCGSTNSTKKPSASSSTSSSVAPPTGSAIPIGFVCSCTGPDASSNAVAPTGMQAWADSVNASGGINGHSINLIVKDDQENPATSVSEVHKLIQQDHVVALVTVSDVDETWANYAEAQHVPVLEANGSDSMTLTDPLMFPASQTIDSLPISVALAAKKVGATKLGLFYCIETAVCAQLVSPERTEAKSVGIDLAYTAGIAASSPNYTAQCLAAKQAGVEAVYVADAATVALSVASSCAQQGYSPHFIAVDGAVSHSFATSPGWDNGMISIQPDIPFSVKDTPGTEAMFSAFSKYEPSLLTNSLFNELAVGGWVDGLLFAAAAQAGGVGVNGPATSAELINGLYDLHATTLGGMSPPLTFNRGKPNSVDCWYWMATTNKQFTTPYGVSPTCAT